MLDPIPRRCDITSDAVDFGSLTGIDCCIKHYVQWHLFKNAGEKRATLQKQIAALQGEIEALNQEAVHELKLKLSDARKVVRDLEEQLSDLSGRTDAVTNASRERRPSIADKALQPQILKVMANFGKDGLNAVQLAEKLQQNPLRIRKFIAANPRILKRQGGGPGTKFFLS